MDAHRVSYEDYGVKPVDNVICRCLLSVLVVGNFGAANGGCDRNTGRPITGKAVRKAKVKELPLVNIDTELERQDQLEGAKKSFNRGSNARLSAPTP
ncbi:hypothetical protein QJS10_CPB19g00274 [Acorus calamus]|uniref:Uncharacterized protein n=1 Tax=Acorus calamus TaxID=4465 RepID=A0AAV9CIR3_ACOCL|nr:hypothetical protein QJS10_CPB19g00274 [Acorus calamus]